MSEQHALVVITLTESQLFEAKTLILEELLNATPKHQILNSLLARYDHLTVEKGKDLLIEVDQELADLSPDDMQKMIIHHSAIYEDIYHYFNQVQDVEGSLQTMRQKEDMMLNWQETVGASQAAQEEKQLKQRSAIDLGRLTPEEQLRFDRYLVLLNYEL